MHWHAPDSGMSRQLLVCPPLPHAIYSKPAATLTGLSYVVPCKRTPAKFTGPSKVLIITQSHLSCVGADSGLLRRAELWNVTLLWFESRDVETVMTSTVSTVSRMRSTLKLTDLAPLRLACALHYRDRCSDSRW